MKLEISTYLRTDKTFNTSKLLEVINNEIPAKYYWFNNLRIYKR